MGYSHALIKDMLRSTHVYLFWDLSYRYSSSCGDGRGIRDTCVFHVFVYIMSADIPLSKASHTIEFKVMGGKVYSSHGFGRRKEIFLDRNLIYHINQSISFLC